ncbi:hypothetical protein M758_12G007400, partial [Ceratodon purpureus]
MREGLKRDLWRDYRVDEAGRGGDIAGLGGGGWSGGETGRHGGGEGSSGREAEGEGELIGGDCREGVGVEAQRAAVRVNGLAGYVGSDVASCSGSPAGCKAGSCKRRPWKQWHRKRQAWRSGNSNISHLQERENGRDLTNKGKSCSIPTPPPS